MTSPPLLAATDLRIDVGGAVAIEHTTFATSGRSLVALGDGFGLLAALLGEGQIRAGSLKLLGVEVNEDPAWRRADWLGAAPFDPPLPSGSTSLEYLAAGARLAGMGRREALRAAAEALASLGLDALEKKLLAACSSAERRAVVLAQAVVAGPAVLVAPAPLSGLAGPDADFVLGVLERARAGRCWIATVSGAHPGSHEHGLAAAADELVVFSSGRLVRQASLADLERGSTGYTLTIRGNVAAFQRALGDRGVDLTGGPERFWVELGPGLSPTDLLALSLQVGAPIVELVPRLLLHPAQ